MSPTKVDLEPGASGAGGIAKEYPINQILIVFYEDDPSELATAKKNVVLGRYAEAQTALDKITDTVSRPEIAQDVDYYKALCAARLALGGSGKIADAGRLMKAFADSNTKSYHYFEASETAGDLLVAVKQFALAAEYYGRLEKAPWPDYRMRAGVAAGRALLAQNKPDEAMTAFDKVLATEAEGELAQSQRVLANLGKAAVLVATKKPDDAIKIVEEVLQKTDPEDAPGWRGPTTSWGPPSGRPDATRRRCSLFSMSTCFIRAWPKPMPKPSPIWRSFGNWCISRSGRSGRNEPSKRSIPIAPGSRKGGARLPARPCGNYAPQPCA